MKHYILSVTISAVLSSVICIASPQKGGFDRLIKFISALIVTSVVLLPIVNIEFNDLTVSEMIIDTENTDYYKETACRSIALSLTESIEIKIGKNTVKQIDIELSDEKSFDIKEIKVYIKTSYTNYSELEKELSNLYNCKILIVEK